MAPMIYTYSGLRINPLEISEVQVRIKDIAHALACCNRFAGHVAAPISVAQHSVYASNLCPANPLQALLHDASEAYMGDVTKWLKASPEFAAYRAAESRLQRTIYRAFGCPEEDTDEVKAADNLLVRYEMLQGFHGKTTVGALNPERDRDYPALTEEEISRLDGLFGGWSYWSWQRAEWMFLRRFNQLTKESDAHQDQEREHGFAGDSDGDTRGYDPDFAAT